MKLNKKGFAFSTMLYGCVALITAVLYIILNINKSSVDTTYYYGEELLKDLNDCITEEISLENCYSGSNASNCNAAAYHACLGVNDSNKEEKGIIIAEALKERVGQGDGLIEDPYTSKRYIYAGTDVKNYLEYAGKVWRIVSIEPGNSLLLLDPNKYITAAWDSGGSDEWGENSSLYSVLNNAYLSTLSDTLKVASFDWRVPVLYPIMISGDYDINALISQEKSTEYSRVLRDTKVGLLLLSDYIKAINDTENNCVKNVLAFNTQNCNSWLIQYKGWVLDVDRSDTEVTTGQAYYFGEETVANPETGVENLYYNRPVLGATDEEYDVYPVISLSKDSVFKGGNGTLASPYVLK